MTLPPSWAAGLLLATAVVAVAWRMGSLSASGALASWTLGVVAMTAGWSWGLLLVAYFIASTALSRFRSAEKRARTGDLIAKSDRRDHRQVLANGGVFGFMALNSLALPWELWQALAAGALAASAADTWATEVGTLVRAEARSIVGLHPVPAGTSGGITAAGTAAAVVGAGFIAALAFAVRWPSSTVVAALAGGVAGALIDSLVGATLQARRHCRKCDMMTEQAEHRCGMPTDVVGGMVSLDNDGVNMIATVSGALIGAAAATFA